MAAHLPRREHAACWVAAVSIGAGNVVKNGVNSTLASTVSAGGTTPPVVSTLETNA